MGAWKIGNMEKKGEKGEKWKKMEKGKKGKREKREKGKKGKREKGKNGKREKGKKGKGEKGKKGKREKGKKGKREKGKKGKREKGEKGKKGFARPAETHFLPFCAIFGAPWRAPCVRKRDEPEKPGTSHAHAGRERSPVAPPVAVIYTFFFNTDYH